GRAAVRQVEVGEADLARGADLRVRAALGHEHVRPVTLAREGTDADGGGTAQLRAERQGNAAAEPEAFLVVLETDADAGEQDRRGREARQWQRPYARADLDLELRELAVLQGEGAFDRGLLAGRRGRQRHARHPGEAVRATAEGQVELVHVERA